jgi:hypothetical protein
MVKLSVMSPKGKEAIVAIAGPVVSVAKPVSLETWRENG